MESLSNIKSLINHIYIHYPFCSSKCNYCGFYSINYDKEIFKKYIISLKNELVYYNKNYDLSNIKTLYFGGGNPSLNTDDIYEINKLISSIISVSSIKEYTIECNPLNINSYFIDLILKTNCNRISLGIQSFTQKAIKYSNRNKQTIDIIHNSLRLLNSLNITISIDLINKLPYSNIETEINNLSIILENYENIKHISFYDLSIDEGSMFYNKNIKSNHSVKYENMFMELLQKHNFIQYEVSNYCKEGYQSQHNKAYWNYNNYIGLGPSAHSTIDNIRIENKKDINEYIKSKNISEIIYLNKKEQIEEFLLMGLRLYEGIDLNKLISRFDFDLLTNCNKVIEKYNINKKIKIDKNMLSMTKKGMNILNSFLVDLYKDIDNYYF